jgi:hypothetical protein
MGERFVVEREAIRLDAHLGIRSSLLPHKFNNRIS